MTEHVRGQPLSSEEWRLYNSHEDFSESIDRSAELPEKVAELDELWWREAESHAVFPIDDRPLKQLLNEGAGMRLGLGGRNRLVLRPRSGHVPLATKIQYYESDEFRSRGRETLVEDNDLWRDDIGLK